MKKFLSIASFAILACFMGCEAPKPVTNGVNTNSNANANANAKPVAAAPTADALLALDKAANEAFIKGDAKYFEGILSDKFTSFDMGMRMSKADMVKMVGGMKCDIKTWSLDEPKMTMIDADTYVSSYKGTWDGTCAGPDGKSMKMPSPIRAASLWVRNGDKWQGAFHGETLIADPKNPSKPLPPPPAEKKADKPAANTNTADKPAAPAMNADVEAMLAAEKSGWEAWKARDAKRLEEFSSKNLAFIDLFGNYTGTQAETVKVWTEGKCDIKSTSVTDASGSMLSPTVGILHFKGSGEGTCNDQKIMPLWGTSIYIKEGNTWKLAFGFEAPAS